jgi:hypothetical protein
MLEKDIVAAIIRLLKRIPRCFAWKEHGACMGQREPDVICCLDGRFFAFESKRRKAGCRSYRNGRSTGSRSPAVTRMWFGR